MNMTQSSWPSVPANPTAAPTDYVDLAAPTGKGDSAAIVADVTVRFNTMAGPVTALDNVSFELRRGEFLALVGRSGSGKTTALNVLAGLIEPTAGVATVLGTQPRAAREKIGYMFARDALLEWRTALRNIEFSLEVRGYDRAQRKAIARKYLDLVHLGAYGSNYPRQLSQGQRQRVALARTWAPSPSLFLMDEPFSALDAQTRESLHEEFVNLWEREKKSVVFVTHDLTEALVLADRVLVFSRGRIVREFNLAFKRPRDPVGLIFDDEARQIIAEIRDLLHA